MKNEEGESLKQKIEQLKLELAWRKKLRELKKNYENYYNPSVNKYNCLIKTEKIYANNSKLIVVLNIITTETNTNTF